MKTFIGFSILLLSVIAAATTTMQIQPAYSQAQHCSSTSPGESTCFTPGQNPTIQRCLDGSCLSGSITHHEAGRLIGFCHNTGAGCTVTPP